MSCTCLMFYRIQVQHPSATRFIKLHYRSYRPLAGRSTLFSLNARSGGGKFCSGTGQYHCPRYGRNAFVCRYRPHDTRYTHRRRGVPTGGAVREVGTICVRDAGQSRFLQEISGASILEVTATTSTIFGWDRSRQQSGTGGRWGCWRG